MERRAAQALLGLGDDADLDGLKRRFRALARDLHPDRGGDPAAFHALQDAYETLRAGLSGEPRPPAPRVARGRPSRDVAPDVATGPTHDEAGAGAGGLTDRLLAQGRCLLLSRAPGSRLNRFATALAVATSSLLLEVVPAGPDGSDTARIVLTGRGRRARRAVSALDLATSGAPWTRRRGDADTVLALELPGGEGDLPRLAHRTLGATLSLLAALAWPLDEWRTVEPPPNGSGPPA